jgi:putative PIN family toxin of toxin-antitoxin system
MRRCVLDTNVLVSAFLWQGMPGRFIQMATDEQIQLFTSQTLLDELADVLPRKHLAKKVQLTGHTVAQLLHHYQRLATCVTAHALPTALSRDPDDNHLIACAIAAQASLLVTGDDDLLVLQHVKGIDILSPTDALQLIDSD